MFKTKEFFKRFDKFSLITGFVVCMVIWIVMISLQHGTRYDINSSARITKFSDSSPSSFFSLHQAADLARGENKVRYASTNSATSSASPVSGEWLRASYRMSRVHNNVTLDLTPSAFDRKVRRNGTIDIVADKPEELIFAVKMFVDDLGGYVVHEQMQPYSLDNKAAEIQIRIPATKYAETVARVRTLSSKVINENSQADDVTGQWVDLDAHIRSLKAQEQQYLVVLKAAQKIPDILTVQEHLDEVRD